AAAAWLQRLDAAQHAHALGIVLSLAAGNMEFLSDGAWTKRLHPGWAAVCGITAAAFAASGYIGPAAPLEGRYGLYNTLLGAGGWELGALGEDLGRDWRTLGVAFKPYPACHFNHAFADCALHLRREHALEAAEIASVTALIHPHQVAIVCEPLAAKQRPQNAYEAQFSVPWIVAAALARGRFTLAEIEPDALVDPALTTLAARVDYADDPHSSYPQYYSAGLLVRTHDGRELYHHIAVNRGTDANPMTESEILDKYRDNATRWVSAGQAERIADGVLSLDAAPNLGELAHALSAAAPPDQRRAC
ncbi:MAG: MmgE/PrpD family protein, partial [Gammaproteobacteria bacterium]